MVLRNPPCHGDGGNVAIIRPRGVCPGVGLACDCADCEVLTASCGSNIGPGDILYVFDFHRCYFNLPPEILLQSHFFATRFKNFGSPLFPSVPEGDDPPGCIWIVSGTCCVEG